MKDDVRLAIMEVCGRAAKIIDEDLQSPRRGRSESERLALVSTFLDVVERACQITAQELHERAGGRKAVGQ